MSKLVPTVTIVNGIAEVNNQYLLVQETDGTWYFPAGRVEIHETIIEGMKREVYEEASLQVDVTGLFKVRHGFLGGKDNPYARLSFFFALRPLIERDFVKVTKSIPDEDTLRAEWFTEEEIKTLPLRTLDVVSLIMEYNILKKSDKFLPIDALEVYVH